MARRRGRQRRSQGDGGNRKSGMDRIGEDVLQNILGRLPALSFASAACVCRSWNSVCNRVLNGPKLSSALSLNDSLEVAVTEVVDKVLSEPLRPHFAIACISPLFCLNLAHELITGKLGSRIPVVTYESKGIIGRDAVTNKFEEVQWYIEDQEDPGTQVGSLFQNVISGILLTVGYLPGLKVDAVPLLQTTKDLDSRVPLVDKFVMDIKEYTTSISGCTPPVGIIMFGDPAINMTSILEKMDYAMPLDTFIVGDECCRFRYRCQGDFGHTTQTGTRSSVAVALLFLRDRNKSHGIGDIEFHFALSTGLSPLGPKFKAATVRERRKESLTWLTARREQSHVILDGQTMLDDINDELTQHLADGIEYPVLYIGVTKRRKYSVGLEKVKWMTSLTFHEITGLFSFSEGMKSTYLSMAMTSKLAIPSASIILIPALLYQLVPISVRTSAT
ncbi:F-box/LRR-repeat protein At5g63520 isoform X2 [Diospyros lotus]|uniref:F-box/LRR-repeat protein At5g63520 isoform X2 n=1 Tax=Diospyros lotus TaxID=55363 RepID=UPI00225A6FB6|nr:F-box/LRR-repeat protein At5g63520 isoform X2 [Diospyros lotus]